MLTAIPRYGARVIPNTQQTIAELRARGQLIEGSQIVAFERAFASHIGAAHAIATSYGRMAFYYLIQALDLPKGSEIVVPALTFWVIPELARFAGLKPVFADVDPRTFTLDPEAFERAITSGTRAVVPTHLYGLPCDMGAIMAISRAHGLKVVEDCAHALGATWRGQPVGTLGDAGFFSFQLLKPLNTYGGGMAVTNDPAVAAKVDALRNAEPLARESDLMRRLFIGRVQRIAIRPRPFTATLFPLLWASSYLGGNPDVYLWESIHAIASLPRSYHTRYTNVQAAIGLEGLKYLETWMASTIRNAAALDEALNGAPIERPTVPDDRTHVFYQYAVYAPRRDEVVRRCVRRGVDVESLHVDVCTRLPLFGNSHAPAPGAERAATAIQLPVYASMTPMEVQRVGAAVRETVEHA